MSQHTGPRGWPKQLPSGNNCVPEGDLFADFATKSSDTHQVKTHPSILIKDSCLPLVKFPRILGIYLDPSLSFNKHSQYVAERVSGRNNILNALACTSWGQHKVTLLITYKAVSRSIINYDAPVWSPNLHDTNYSKIQCIQKEVLKIATGCHKMSRIDHLHRDAKG